MYSPATDQWTSLGATPLQARVNATACVHEGLVYIGLGFAGGGSKDSLYLRDWWVYNPKENSWTALADYPNSYTDCASAFVGEKELYVGYGFCWQYRRDMFRYNIRENTWDSIDVGVAFHGYPTRSFGGTGTTCQRRHFMGTGYYRYSLDWWAELVDGTHWEERTPVPGWTRTLAKTTATENYIYLSGGMHYGGVATTAEVLQDIRRYDPQNDQWTYVAILPERLFNHITFAIGKRIYFGLGETEEWKVQNKLYYIEE
jgi:N-acetylneuraminic acid mutarotase